MLHLAEVELLPGASLEDVQHVQAGRLEVRGGVVGLGDEQLVGSSVICWLKGAVTRREYGILKTLGNKKSISKYWKCFKILISKGIYRMSALIILHGKKSEILY